MPLEVDLKELVKLLDVIDKNGLTLSEAIKIIKMVNISTLKKDIEYIREKGKSDSEWIKSQFDCLTWLVG